MIRVNKNYEFEIFTAVTTKNVVLLDVVPYKSCVNRHSSETSVHTRFTQNNIPEYGILQILSKYGNEDLSETARQWSVRELKTLKYCQEHAEEVTKKLRRSDLGIYWIVRKFQNVASDCI
jgi:hypothetical protein